MYRMRSRRGTPSWLGLVKLSARCQRFSAGPLAVEDVGECVLPGQAQVVTGASQTPHRISLPSLRSSGEVWLPRLPEVSFRPSW